jgi:hypothetical protein
MVTVEEPQQKEAKPSRQSIEISIIGGPNDRIDLPP